MERETQVDVQDQLINTRLTWLGNFSGFLVAGVALALNSKQAPASLVLAISILGAVVAASTFVGTLAANLVIAKRAKEENWSGRWKLWFMPGTIIPPLVFLWWIVVATLPTGASGPTLSAAINVTDASTLTSVAAVVGALTGSAALAVLIVQEVRRRRERRSAPADTLKTEVS